MGDREASFNNNSAGYHTKDQHLEKDVCVSDSDTNNETASIARSTNRNVEPESPKPTLETQKSDPASFQVCIVHFQFDIIQIY